MINTQEYPKKETVICEHVTLKGMRPKESPIDDHPEYIIEIAVVCAVCVKQYDIDFGVG